MSFNAGMDEPHAYVAYLDGEKECIPLSFVFKFPVDWRQNGWDINYLFKVFWSPKEEDSPQQLLRKLPVVPVFEQGSSMEKAGYYRAAVVKVKESRKELLEDVEGKRVSVGVLKYKYTSTDKLGDKSTKPDLKKKGNAPILTKSKKDKKGNKNKKGLNVCAQLNNTDQLRDELTSRFPSLIKHVENSEPKSSIISKPSRTEPCDPGSSSDCPDTEPCTSDDVATIKTSEKDGVQSDKPEPESGSSVTPVLPKSSSSKWQRSCKRTWERTTSPSSDSDELGKKIKYDLDYTPRKYEKLKEEVIIKNVTIKRISNLNLKLQEDKIRLEEQVSELERSLAELKGQAKLSSTKPLQVVTAAAKPHPPGNAKRHLDFEENLLNATSEEPADNKLRETTNEIDPSALCETQILSPHFRENDLVNELGNDATREKSVDEIPGLKIPDHVRTAIFSIPAGEKRDLRFIKDLCVAAFGPEVLAASSICGSLKGGKKLQEGAAKVKKPALCKDMLQAVRDALIKRVEDEEKCKIGDPDKHLRTNRKRFNDAIFDGQKKYRSKGYGLGEKSNSVTTELFK